jgi:S-adenosylmethionine-diacylgycerolhomoserine-N-methlytransferase
MSIAADIKTIWSLAVSGNRGLTHSDRLENFYASQADHYDDFRENFLTGRRELIKSIPWLQINSWTDLGAGTGGLLEFASANNIHNKKISLVDLSPSLLSVATKRIKRLGLTGASIHQADVATFGESDSVDLVTMSYSLSMIPDWFLAVDNAHRILRPGGTLAVADFYVSRKHPSPGRARHGWLSRHFWPAWFGMDNVHVTSEHIEYLSKKFSDVVITESFTKVPYLFGMKVPVFRFIGIKN